MQLLGAEQKVLQVARYVPAAAVHDHLIVAAPGVLHHRLIEIELRALLVVVGDLEPAAAPHLAVLDRDLAQQCLDQRALAGTVGPDQPDAIAAHDPAGVVPDDRAAVELDTQVLGFEHQGTRFGGDVLFQLDAAAALAPGAALRAQLVQGAYPALVAGASRLDALADPDLFLRELFVAHRLL